MYATRSRKVKTGRSEARALAAACLLGAYRPAHRLSDPQRHVRGRLLVRDAVVRTRTRDISLIRARLRQHGSRVPSGSAEHFGHRVQGLPLPGRLLSVVAPRLAVMGPLRLTGSGAVTRLRLGLARNWARFRGRWSPLARVGGTHSRKVSVERWRGAPPPFPRGSR